MKLKYFFVGLVLFFVPALAHAEQVDSFNSVVTINKDATVRVVETINYDFGELFRHGIFRDIPVKYKNVAGNLSIGLSQISVTDDSGVNIPFNVSNKGSEQEIKIGDANKTITGQHVYVIGYTASRAILYNKTDDSFAWNVTGNDWPVPIASASATIKLPGEVEVAAVMPDCFAGVFGSTTKCEDVSFNSSVSQTTSVLNFSQSNLQPGEGFTVQVHFPSGTVTKPTAAQNFLQILRDNWVLGFPVLVFIILMYLWSRFGRDPKVTSTIIPEYEAPEGLTPAEMGAILDQRAGADDITAEIIYLATKGYIKITRLQEKILIFNKTDYQLDLLKSADGLPEFDKMLADALFGGAKSVKLSDLKNKFFKNLPYITKSIFASVINKGYFPNNPNTVRTAYAVIGAILLFGSFWSAGIFGLLGAASGVVSGILFFIFAAIMPRRTVLGAQMKNYILGFKQFLAVTETDRLKFFNAPAKSPEQFEKLLPYAMVLGVEKEWAGQFEGLYKQPPSWYHDPSGAAFSAVYLSSSLHDFGRSTSQTMASHPSSSGGGGSSGGGFGGGGGGSW